MMACAFMMASASMMAPPGLLLAEMRDFLRTFRAFRSRGTVALAYPPAAGMIVSTIFADFIQDLISNFSTIFDF